MPWIVGGMQRWPSHAGNQMREEIAVGWPRVTGIHCPSEVFDLADKDSDTDGVNSREKQVPPTPRPVHSPVVGFSVSDNTV